MKAALGVPPSLGDVVIAGYASYEALSNDCSGRELWTILKVIDSVGC